MIGYVQTQVNVLDTVFLRQVVTAMGMVSHSVTSSSDEAFIQGLLRHLLQLNEILDTEEHKIEVTKCILSMVTHFVDYY